MLGFLHLKERQMTISMYEASIPVLVRMLGNLRAILEKASTHAQAHNFDSAVLAGDRLYPDMFPMTRQVQIATDMAKGCAARLAGGDPPSYADTETTLPELVARIDKTIAFLQTFKPDQINGSEARDIKLTTRRGDLHFNGQQYLLNFVLPNFYFHVTTAYNILRHNGVALGKGDYLGAS
jgi:hypothetical protein